MNFLKIIVIICFALQPNEIMSQEIASYKWKNRILLVITEDSLNTTFLNQIKELKNHESGLKERKLEVFLVTKEGFTLGLNNNSFKKNTELYKNFNDTNASFKAILIGLDGGVKLTQTDFISCKKLFSIIDVMPMRREEIKNN